MREALLLLALFLVYFAMSGFAFLIRNIGMFAGGAEDARLHLIIFVISVILFAAIWLTSYALRKP